MTRIPACALGAATTVSLLGAGLVAVAGPASAALPAACKEISAHNVTCTWDTTAPATFTVPTGVTALDVEVEGAPGGNGAANSVGGAGALVTGRLTGIVPKSDLTILVGGPGGSNGNGGGSGGANGGGSANRGAASNSGGGGGASDIRTGTGLESRLVVAAGGGGAGYFGRGGTAEGADGSAGQNYYTSREGAGGTTTHGGTAGTNDINNATAPTDGTEGQGGSGSAIGSTPYGGGGGGGLYGGGGGGYGAGGGAGSSLVPAGGTIAASTTSTPHVTISYDPDPPVLAGHASIKGVMNQYRDQKIFQVINRAVGAGPEMTDADQTQDLPGNGGDVNADIDPDAKTLTVYSSTAKGKNWDSVVVRVQDPDLTQLRVISDHYSSNSKVKITGQPGDWTLTWNDPYFISDTSTVLSYGPEAPPAQPTPPATGPFVPGPLGLATADVPHLRGHMMSIDATGFTPGETYQVKISGVVVGHGTADAKGEIHRKVRVPLRAHRPRAKLVVKGSTHRVHRLIRIRDGIAKP